MLTGAGTDVNTATDATGHWLTELWAADHPSGSGAAGLRQVGVAEPHRHRSFADRGGGAPDGPAADVTDGEDPRQAGLEQERVASRVLPGRSSS